MEATTQNKSHVSASVDWCEGQKDDFKELHKAIKTGTVKKNECLNEESGDEFCDQTDMDQRAFADFSQVSEFQKYKGDSSSEEDDSEPEEPEPKFLWAAQHNNVELIKDLYSQNSNLVKFADSDGYTALHRAAYSGSKESLVILLSFGADLSALTADGWTPLHSASRWNRAACVEILLSWGADVNKSTTGGQTPLHLAAVCPDSSDTLMILLLQPKIKPMQKNCQDDTPKDIAKRNANPTDVFDLALPCFTQT